MGNPSGTFCKKLLNRKSDLGETTVNIPFLSQRLSLPALGFILVTSVLARPIDSNGDAKFLTDKEQRFATYNRDFADFIKAHINDSEFAIVNDLRQTAGVNVERIESIKTLMEIYEESACKPDQSMVRVHLRDQLKFYLGLIDLDVKTINIDLSHTELPAVSQTAINMKDDLREVKSRFEDIRGRE